jgi:nucleoside-diphosphate-sugar epimerase
MKELIIFGGGGYCGSVLVPQLLKESWNVTVFDTFWYGTEHLPKNDNLTLIKGDVRDIKLVSNSLVNKTHVLHLSCISNDTSFELDENLSTSVNYNSFEPLVIEAKKNGIKRFVFASSSSVYGVSDLSNITEEHPLVPLTLYNKFKGLCEPLLLKHVDEDFVGVVFRPATVCGYGPRQRLDLSVNILTNHAINKGKITVFGGEQLRPNLHIQDYAEVCKLLLVAPNEIIAGEIFNVGVQNLTIMNIAKTVKKVVEEFFPEKGKIPLEVTSSDDLRSYHICSDKIERILGYVPKHTVEDAIRDLCKAFSTGLLQNSLEDNKYYNVKTMKAINAK